jgi:membrane protease YdiL (CAAX protease family)
VGWVVGLIVLTVGIGVLYGLSAHMVLKAAGVPRGSLMSALALMLGLALIVAVYVLAVRTGERRAVEEFALPGAFGQLAAGVGGGVALFALVMALLVAGGDYTVRLAPSGTPWQSFAYGIQGGVFEELLFRGVLMRLLWEAFGWPLALVVSATLFGLAHLANPGNSVAGALLIIFEAGLPLGAIYLLTGRLWAGIGAHFGWNFAQGYLFGAEVSGNDPGGHVLLSAPRAGVPALLTGGTFGPEASLTCLAVGTTAGVLLVVWARRRSFAQWRAA